MQYMIVVGFLRYFLVVHTNAPQTLTHQRLQENGEKAAMFVSCAELKPITLQYRRSCANLVRTLCPLVVEKTGAISFHLSHIRTCNFNDTKSFTCNKP